MDRGDDPPERSRLQGGRQTVLWRDFLDRRFRRQHRALAHEIWHLLGFVHHPDGPNSKGPPGEGVPMSLALNGQRATNPNDLGVRYKDVDALRCIFPEGGPG